MKLFRHGPPGQERAGVVDAQGTLRDLSSVVPDITAEWIEAGGLASLATVDPQRLPEVAAGRRLGCPVKGVRQLLAVGLNYRAHAAEAGQPIPAEPILFNKAITALSGPDDDVLIPPEAQALDWEVELAVVIGRVSRRVPVASALSHVAGYCLSNDVSERDWQFKRGGQWGKGKSLDTFAPIGPWLVTADEIADPQAIRLELAVNGQTVQSSSTADMIFGVADLVAHISTFQTLLPGDIVMTGTPQGVGLGMKPPRFLKPGDEMVLNGGPLGRQRQTVRLLPG